MSAPIRVDLGNNAYDVLVEDGLIDRAGSVIRKVAKTGQLVVVSDQDVWRAAGDRLVAGLAPDPINPILLPPGEATKCWTELEKLVDQLLARGVSRGDHIIAFGGGVVGDLAGFSAAILKRGCNLIQVPTSLLAQVDSSVGGKTGINTAAGKNLVGAFHQPVLVLVDPSLLATLDPRHLRAGYAEIVKYALIEDQAFFAWLEEHGQAVLARDPAALTHALRASIDGKRRIVEQDERETHGRRILLNLGHSFAHALEAEAGFGARLVHGEAVAVGLAYAFRLSEELGLCPANDAERVEAHLTSLGLPISFPADPAALLAHLRHDKKGSADRLRLVLARGIGGAFITDEVSPAKVERFLQHRARSALS